MKKIFVICLCIVLCAGTRTMAKKDKVTVNVPIEKWDGLRNEKEALLDSVTRLNDTIASYRQQLLVDADKMAQLSADADSMSRVIDKLQLLESRWVNDSIAFVEDSLRLHQQYQKREAEVAEQLHQAELKSARADTIAIQMMITYLDLKCKESRVIALRQNFQSIANDTLKRDYKEIDNILALYTETYQKVKSLAQDELKTKKIASATSSLTRDIAIDDYKKSLDDLDYVKKYYRNQENTSPYLNQMLDISYKALKEKDIELLNKILEL